MFFEFLQPSLDLVGCFIYHNKIEIPIGVAEITSIRKDPVILIRGNKMVCVEQYVSRATIIKSNKGKKNYKANADGEIKMKRTSRLMRARMKRKSWWRRQRRKPKRKKGQHEKVFEKS